MNDWNNLTVPIGIHEVYEEGSWKWWARRLGICPYYGLLEATKRAEYQLAGGMNDCFGGMTSSAISLKWGIYPREDD